MDTAIASYEGRNAAGEKVIVDLIGAVHIGDKKYYKQLNKEFKSYDAVLYELVAPKNSRPQRGQAGAYQPIGAMLDLDDQIEWIDYEQENFVHADMSWDEVVSSMEKRNESLLKMYFRMIGYSIAKQSEKENGGGSDANLLAALLFASNKSLASMPYSVTRYSSISAAAPSGEGFIRRITSAEDCNAAMSCVCSPPAWLSDFPTSTTSSAWKSKSRREMSIAEKTPR